MCSTNISRPHSGSSSTPPRRSESMDPSTSRSSNSISSCKSQTLSKEKDHKSSGYLPEGLTSSSEHRSKSRRNEDQEAIPRSSTSRRGRFQSVRSSSRDDSHKHLDRTGSCPRTDGKKQDDLRASSHHSSSRSRRSRRGTDGKRQSSRRTNSTAEGSKRSSSLSPSTISNNSSKRSSSLSPHKSSSKRDVTDSHSSKRSSSLSPHKGSSRRDEDGHKRPSSSRHSKKSSSRNKKTFNELMNNSWSVDVGVEELTDLEAAILTELTQTQSSKKCSATKHTTKSADDFLAKVKSATDNANKSCSSVSYGTDSDYASKRSSSSKHHKRSSSVDGSEADGHKSSSSLSRSSKHHKKSSSVDRSEADGHKSSSSLSRSSKHHKKSSSMDGTGHKSSSSPKKSSSKRNVSNDANKKSLKKNPSILRTGDVPVSEDSNSSSSLSPKKKSSSTSSVTGLLKKTTSALRLQASLSAKETAEEVACKMPDVLEKSSSFSLQAGSLQKSNSFRLKPGASILQKSNSFRLQPGSLQKSNSFRLQPGSLQKSNSFRVQKGVGKRDKLNSLRKSNSLRLQQSFNSSLSDITDADTDKTSTTLMPLPQKSLRPRSTTGTEKRCSRLRPKKILSPRPSTRRCTERSHRTSRTHASDSVRTSESTGLRSSVRPEVKDMRRRRCTGLSPVRSRVNPDTSGVRASAPTLPSEADRIMLAKLYGCGPGELHADESQQLKNCEEAAAVEPMGRPEAADPAQKPEDRATKVQFSDEIVEHEEEENVEREWYTMESLNALLEAEIDMARNDDAPQEGMEGGCWRGLEHVRNNVDKAQNIQAHVQSIRLKQITARKKRNSNEGADDLQSHSQSNTKQDKEKAHLLAEQDAELVLQEVEEEKRLEQARRREDEFRGSTLVPTLAMMADMPQVMSAAVAGAGSVTTQAANLATIAVVGAGTATTQAASLATHAVADATANTTRMVSSAVVGAGTATTQAASLATHAVADATVNTTRMVSSAVVGAGTATSQVACAATHAMADATMNTTKMVSGAVAGAGTATTQAAKRVSHAVFGAMVGTTTKTSKLFSGSVRGATATAPKTGASSIRATATKTTPSKPVASAIAA